MSPYLYNLDLASAVWGYAPEGFVLLSLVAFGIDTAYALPLFNVAKVFVALLYFAGLWVIDCCFL